METIINCTVLKKGIFWICIDAASNNIYAQGKTMREVNTRTLSHFTQENIKGLIVIKDGKGKVKLKRELRDNHSRARNDLFASYGRKIPKLNQ